MCAKEGDPQLLNTFLAGKDLYSEIASVSFNFPYDDCKEFFPKGTPIRRNPQTHNWERCDASICEKYADGSTDTNVEGKARRSRAKIILLGILYGMSIDTVAQQLNCSTDKAEQIKNDVFNGFPIIKIFEEKSINMAKAYGYVTTVCGRKRRLPDIRLPEYSFEFTEQYKKSSGQTVVPQNVCESYTKKMKSMYRNQRNDFINEARRDGIIIRQNSGKISQAVRQCVNSRIQGSAADLTKVAMIQLNNNEELRRLGFRMLIPVHDEIIAECPEENIKRCSELLAATMCGAAEKILQMPIDCDVSITRCWYGDEVDISKIN